MRLELEGRQIASRLGEKVPGFAVAFEAVAGFFLGRCDGADHDVSGAAGCQYYGGWD